MSQHGARLDPPGSPQHRQRVLDGKEGRLRIGRATEVTGGGLEQHLDQGPPQQRGRHRGATVEVLPEPAVGRVELRAHPGTLRPLTGKQERHVRPVRVRRQGASFDRHPAIGHEQGRGSVLVV